MLQPLQVAMATERTPAEVDSLYREASAQLGPALERLARAYEANEDRQDDLLQEMSVALWRSLARYDGRCSLRTWVFRVAHNVGASHVAQDRRMRTAALTTLDELEATPGPHDVEAAAEQRQAQARLMSLIHSLRPVDRQLILLYLEGLDAASIADITGLSPSNVATKVHRLKRVLAQRFHAGAAA